MAKQRWPFEASAQGLGKQLVLLERRGLPGGWLMEYKFHPTRRWKFDFANELLKIAVEYNGGLFMARRGGHQSVKGTRNDWEKLNSAQILGWMCLQFGPDETRSGEAMNVIERAIQARQAQ